MICVHEVCSFCVFFARSDCAFQTETFPRMRKTQKKTARTIPCCATPLLIPDNGGKVMQRSRRWTFLKSSNLPCKRLPFMNYSRPLSLYFCPCLRIGTSLAHFICFCSMARNAKSSPPRVRTGICAILRLLDTLLL